CPGPGSLGLLQLTTLVKLLADIDRIRRLILRRQLRQPCIPLRVQTLRETIRHLAPRRPPAQHGWFRDEHPNGQHAVRFLSDARDVLPREANGLRGSAGDVDQRLSDRAAENRLRLAGPAQEGRLGCKWLRLATLG